MKVFNLSCEHDHPFEGWFASAQEFDRQLADGVLECPVCASHAIHKTPSAPRLGLHAEAPARAATGRVPAAMPNDPGLHAAMVALARRIASQCEDVGERFSEEARRIHYDEAPRRGIRGVASSEEVQELADEGIEVMPVPFADAVKSTLQ